MHLGDNGARDILAAPDARAAHQKSGSQEAVLNSGAGVPTTQMRYLTTTLPSLRCEFQYGRHALESKQLLSHLGRGVQSGLRGRPDF